MVNLDDIHFNINGRVLSDGRREEVLPSDISFRTGYHHDDFRDDKVALSNNCVDGIHARKKLLKAQFLEEWSAIEV
jgi:hypothetical protein